jgi:hypothetical protein
VFVACSDCRAAMALLFVLIENMLTHSGFRGRAAFVLAVRTRWPLAPASGPSMSRTGS